MPAFEAKCSMKLEGDNLSGIHAAISEFSTLADERKDVLETFFMQRDRLEDVGFLLEAKDEARAIALAEALIAEIEAAAAERFGKGTVTRGELDVNLEDAETENILELLADLEDAAAQDPPGDPFEAMLEAGTSSTSFDLGTDDIIEQFREWSRTTAFDIVDVGTSFVTVIFQGLPEDVEGFAAEAYAFCPDLADDLADAPNGDAAGFALAGIATQIREERLLRFWWD
jgi:hypothetical protein